ncbi:hypothetical protein [Draconibacterium sediminis]|uniref:Uncharacterized protein n=1 Tax=Draconibacterium sediminis TaxID=1544798 RepID=A0A0D8J8W1_9BACT|nr:hypothetical protein [Draconibacterium sediminis]KJF43425.1 hypothetical protein LH29_14445 [Draconibacterium sediminis]
MPPEIPLPIQYNPYKHHFRFLLSEIKEWRTSDWNVTEKAMLSIGSNLFDFYLGELTPGQVCNASLNYFVTKNIITQTDFNNWLRNAEWKKITLPDESKWLIKRGDQPDRYVHIHPAKFSTHTIRVRATTLKTVLTLCVHKIPFSDDAEQNLQSVNKQRISYLQLSPIKSLEEEDSGILKLWQLFVNAGAIF